MIGDLNKRRGQVEGTEATRSGASIVKAMVPLAEMFGYATAIRSLSRGRASYSMEPEEFAVVPRAVKESILNR